MFKHMCTTEWIERERKRELQRKEIIKCSLDKHTAFLPLSPLCLRYERDLKSDPNLNAHGKERGGGRQEVREGKVKEGFDGKHLIANQVNIKLRCFGGDFLFEILFTCDLCSEMLRKTFPFTAFCKNRILNHFKPTLSGAGDFLVQEICLNHEISKENFLICLFWLSGTKLPTTL